MARTVRVYRSSDGSAPVLTGTAGDMVNLLDKCLVAGYGAAAAAGWTKDYTGTNKATFRNSASDGTGTYYRCQDDLATTGQKYAYIAMYETMSAVDTGTLAYPTVNSYMGVQKSNTQDATARDWVIVADNCAAHIFIKHGANGTDFEYFFMGDIFSFKSSDAYRAAIIGRYSTSFSSSAYTSCSAWQNKAVPNTDPGCGITRSHAGTGSGIACGLHTDAYKANTSPTSATYFGGATYTMLAYPNAVNSGILVAPLWIHQNTTSPYIVRGYLPGIWSPLHNRPIAQQDTYSGAGSLAGKTFEAFNIYSSAQVHVETSNTWS